MKKQARNRAEGSGVLKYLVVELIAESVVRLVVELVVELVAELVAELVTELIAELVFNKHENLFSDELTSYCF